MIVKKYDFTFIGLRDLLINNGELYLSVILQDLNEKLSQISIMYVQN